MTPFDALPEKDLQRLIRALLADTAREWSAEGGVRVQVLSVGEWNHAAGPDFLGMAIAAEGRVHVGNAEFHRAASDWRAHEHSLNPAYAGLLLHIVLKNDSEEEFAHYTLVVPEEDVKLVDAERVRKTQILTHQPLPESASHHVSSPEARELLQSLARQRLEQKADYAGSLLNPYKPHETLIRLVEEFGARQRTKKRRPRGVAQIQAIATFLQNTPRNPLFSFLENFLTDAPERITYALSHLLECRINTEGAGTRQELVVNVVLPLAIALCRYSSGKHSSTLWHEQTLWSWYFELESHNFYTPLKERFPAVSQAFVFEQQGLLQYLAELAPVQSAKPALQHIHAISAHLEGEYIVTLYAA